LPDSCMGNRASCTASAFVNLLAFCAAAAAAAAAGVYPGVTTSELDELAAQTAAYMATQHPGWSQLAARISVSNLHKNTCKVFSENIEQLHKYVHPKTGAPAPLISDEVYEIVQKHKDTLNSAIINDRDCECCSPLGCLRRCFTFVT
jgi:hypothetical protein